MSESEKDLLEYQLKHLVMDYFKDNHSDEFGYVSEKCERIEKLNFNNMYQAFIMLHPHIRMILYRKLSYNGKRYLIDNQIFNEEGKLNT